MLGDSKVEPISAADERRLVRTLEHVIGYVNAGDDPTAALTKASLQEKLSRHFVDRVAEAYNISRTLAHVKQSKEQNRATDFPLANAAEAAERIWPSAVKAASATARDWSPPDPERETVAWRGSGPSLQELLGMEKAAHAKPQDWPEPADVRDGRRIAELRRAELTKAAALQEAGEVRDNLLSGIGKVAQYLRMFGADPLAEVERRTVSRFGPEGKCFIDFLCKAAAIDQPRATPDSRQFAFPPREPYRTIELCIKLASDLVRAAEKAGAEQARHDAIKETFPGVALAKKAEQDKQAIMGLGGINPLTAAAVTLPYLGIKERTGADAAEKWKSDVYDPKLDEEEAQADMKVMMSDFMNNDPIISGYPEPTIRQAYNSVARMAPLASREPLIMRGLLRRMLQQDNILEAHEAEQLAKLEKSLRGGPAAA